MSEQGIWLAVLAAALLLPVAFGAAARGPRSLRRRRPYPEAPVKAFGLLEAVEARIARTPFDRMSLAERRLVVDLLWRADAQEVGDEVHARIHALLAELALQGGRRETALEHFRNAQIWDPQVGRPAA